MSTPELPAELWSYIFSFSCMDDGRTGCALQRVSKHFRELSKPFRLTSVCLYRSKDILKFEAAIDPLPPNERRVQYLHITSPHLFLDVSEDGDDDDYQTSESDSSRFDTDADNDDTFPSEGSLEEENLETNSDNSDSDEDEYQPLSIAEQEEVHDDIKYLKAAPSYEDYSVSALYRGKYSMAKYKSEMDQANSIILAAVNNIISTLSSTLYALSIHWTKEFNSEYLSIPDFIPPRLNLPCLTELYICVNLRSYTNDPIRDTYPESMFYGENYHEKFNGLTLPALRRLRYAGLAWSYVGRPYDVIRQMAPNITHIRTKMDLMRGDFSLSTFPTNLNVFIELPDETLRDRDGEKIESFITGPENMHGPQHVAATIGMCIPDAYDADCWEAHWEAGLRDESGHWPEPGDFILSSRE